MAHADQRLRVLSWNVQFCAGRRSLFFYDGGAGSRVTAAEVNDTLAGITAIIRRESPDLVLLQEVDRCSTRTARIDQHRVLQRGLGYPVHGSTPYFKVPFVPVPAHAPMGAVNMHLSVFSRYALHSGERIALSTLDEPRWRRAFNLRRALMRLSMPMEGGLPLQLFLTHLSAFSRGDGTLDRQVQTVIREVSKTAGPCLLAGDFNSLPPGDQPLRLGSAAALYREARTPIEPLFDALEPLCPPRNALLDEGFQSYVPWGSMRPDRTIDYLFGRQLQVDRVRVLAEGGRWSDHLPLVVDFSVGGSNTSG